MKEEKIDMKQPIDGKYEFEAVNPCTGNKHNHFDAAVFLAKDAAFQKMVQSYPGICESMGADPEQVEGARRMVARIMKYAVTHQVKVPDVVNDCEINHVMNPGGESGEGA